MSWLHEDASPSDEEMPLIIDFSVQVAEVHRFSLFQQHLIGFTLKLSVYNPSLVSQDASVGVFRVLNRFDTQDLVKNICTFAMILNF